MDRDGRREWDRVEALFNAPPTVVELDDGSVLVEKAGLVGVGRTVEDAVRELGAKFAAAMLAPDRRPARAVIPGRERGGADAPSPASRAEPGSAASPRRGEADTLPSRVA